MLIPKSDRQILILILEAYQMNLVNGTIMVDDNTMYVSVPKLLNDTYRLQLDMLGAD